MHSLTSRSTASPVIIRLSCQKSSYVLCKRLSSLLPTPSCDSRSAHSSVCPTRWRSWAMPATSAPDGAPIQKRRLLLKQTEKLSVRTLPLTGAVSAFSEVRILAALSDRTDVATSRGEEERGAVDKIFGSARCRKKRCVERVP